MVIEMRSVRFRADPFQVWLCGLFIIINLALLVLAQPSVLDGNLMHPAYALAPDGARYWEAALSLLRDGTFSYLASDGQSHALVRGGPISPIFYAIFIKLFGFDGAPYFFIPVQCALLYGLGLFARKLAEIFGANQNLVQALIVLNPNLIGIAHFGQSEALICFFFGALIVTTIRFLTSKSNKGLVGYCIWMGILSGVTTLIRPASFFFSLLLPVLVALIFVSLNQTNFWRRVKEGTLVIGIIAASSAIVMAPWAIRNAHTLGNPAIVQGSHAALEDSLARMLVKNGVGDEAEVLALIRRDLLETASRSSLNLACFDPDLPPPRPAKQCKWERTEAYVRLIASQPIGYMVKGFAFATFSTYFAGGATAISNILGIRHASDEILYSEFPSLRSMRSFVYDKIEEHDVYIILALITGAFASVCRAFGLVGVFAAFRFRHLLGAHFFCLATILVFSATFLFTGVSRFRAPLEIILMTYAAVGLKELFQRIKPNQTSKADSSKHI